MRASGPRSHKVWRKPWMAMRAAHAPMEFGSGIAWARGRPARILCLRYSMSGAGLSTEAVDNFVGKLVVNACKADVAGL